MRSELRGRLAAAGVALFAAFLWSTYYLFVLAVTPEARPSAVLFYPFVGGGVAYALWVVTRRQGRLLARSFADGRAYVRVALLLALQFSVLAATYLTGPVDAALLSLLGDVVATPVVVTLLFVEHRGDLRSPLLILGLVLSLAGGTLAIAGGHGLAAVHGLAWTVVIVVPLAVAFYFVLSAKAGARMPVSVVVAQSMLSAAVGVAALSPLVPGGARALLEVGVVPLTLLLLNGLASFFVAPVLYFRSIDRAGFIVPPMMMTGIPVFTLLLSAVVLGIPPVPLALLGVPVAALGGIVGLAAGSADKPVS